MKLKKLLLFSVEFFCSFLENGGVNKWDVRFLARE